MDKITKDVRGGVKEFLYADELVPAQRKLGRGRNEICMTEKSYDRKRVESKCKEDKGFLYWRGNCSNENFQFFMREGVEKNFSVCIKCNC